MYVVRECLLNYWKSFWWNYSSVAVFLFNVISVRQERPMFITYILIMSVYNQIKKDSFSIKLSSVLQALWSYFE